MSVLGRRELYCPAHFGNSYESMWPNEMRDVLAEAKHWGFNAYSDWFDSADLKNPRDNPRGETLLPQALWERKIAHFRSAAELGFSVGLVLTPNHVFLDQLRADLLADTSDTKHFGQLLCPSVAEARAIILRNHRELFEDLRVGGIHLTRLSACPYDYGGCGCGKCAPWIVTFGALFAEIHECAADFFPDIEADLIGWWWTEAEHVAFNAWADANHPGMFGALSAHIPYGETFPESEWDPPAECRRQAFVHIGYADKAQPRDVYGPWGPTVAPARLQATLEELSAAGYEGFMAYSEGVFDDVNKAVLGGLSSGLCADAHGALEEYAERYFGATAADRTDWAYWIAGWGDAFARDTGKARTEFDRLSRSARPGWRLAQLEAKLRIFEAHNAARGHGPWTDDRTRAAESFWVERERLQRGIWGLGIVRHVLNDALHRPDWFDDWTEHVGESAGAKADDVSDEA